MKQKKKKKKKEKRTMVSVLLSAQNTLTVGLPDSRSMHTLKRL
jgi:hypothetical protein